MTDKDLSKVAIACKRPIAHSSFDVRLLREEQVLLGLYIIYQQ
ncbi:hypothetical protein [Brasilonema bromeliae]|nr:hypothetical protein [Brasilonema bromeliae]